MKTATKSRGPAVNCASVIDSRARMAKARGGVVAFLAILLLLSGGCSSSKKPDEGKMVLRTQSGETGIQVTESEQDGTQVIRIKTTFRGKESVIVLAVDQPVYEVDIPLSIQQVNPGFGRPGEGGGGGAGPGDFQALLLAQQLEKAQKSMMDGVYNDALRQVNLVLNVRPDHIKAHEMKGSIYYAMGNFELANEEWENVLAMDPSNEEVRSFMEFLKNRQGAAQPPLPAGLPARGPNPPGAQGAQPAGGQTGTN